MKKFIQNDEGSIFASVVLIITLSAVLLMGLTNVLKNQVIQYHNIKNVYEAKSMIEMSEYIVNDQIKNESIETGGEIHFSSGDVQFIVVSKNKIKMDVTLTNGFTSSKYVPIDLKNSNDVQEADELENGSKNVKSSEVDNFKENLK